MSNFGNVLLFIKGRRNDCNEFLFGHKFLCRSVYRNRLFVYGVKDVRILLMPKPEVSVIMPVFNSEEFVAEAIESILSQTFKAFEFIIIDDASTDTSWQIIKKYASEDKRIRAYRNSRNLKTTKTLNRGLRLSKGKYVVRMDADDWSYPERIAKQVEYMNKHLEVGVSGGAVKICNKNLKTINTRLYPLTDGDIRKKIFRYCPFAHPATIWRTKVVKGVGGYNENIPLTQDYELYFRIGRTSNFGNLDEVILNLRTHGSSSSLRKGKVQERYVIYSRIKGCIEYGYEMNFADKFYTLAQIISMAFVPPRLKFWIFNFLRRQR